MSIEAREMAKIAALVAGGAVIGAGLGLLYAPKSGAETRRQLRHYARKAQVEATKIGRQVRAGMDHAVEVGKSFVSKREEKRAAEAA